MQKRSPNRITNEIQNIRGALHSLDRSLRRLAPLLSTAVLMNGAPKDNGRSRPRLSPKVRASMVLQGRYMGYMGQLKPRQKVQVRKIKEVDGVRAAIVRARIIVSIRSK